MDVPIDESMVSTLDTLSVKNSLMMLMVQKKPGLRLADICEFFSEGLGKR